MERKTYSMIIIYYSHDIIQDLPYHRCHVARVCNKLQPACKEHDGPVCDDLCHWASGPGPISSYQNNKK